MNLIWILGWCSPTDSEIISTDDALRFFSIASVSRAEVAFDREKLAWFASAHIRKMSRVDIFSRSKNLLVSREIIKNVISDDEVDRIHKAISLIRPNLKTFNEVPVLIGGVLYGPAMNPSFRRYISQFISDINLIGNIIDALLGVDEVWTHKVVELCMKNLADTQNIELRDISITLQISLLGEAYGPDWWRVLVFLGKKESLKRLGNVDILLKEIVQL